MALTGNEKLSYILRGSTSAELYLHCNFFASNQHFSSLLAQGSKCSLLKTMYSSSLTLVPSNVVDDQLEDYSEFAWQEALNNCQDEKWSQFICMLALSSVLGIPINSYFPNIAKGTVA